jgi:hypothetical protein
LQGGGEGAAADFAEGLAFGGEDGVVGARGRGGAGHAEAGEFAGEPGGFFLEESVLTDEVFFVEGDKEAEAGLEGGVVGGEVVAVEGVAHFEAEGVAGAEATGESAFGLDGCDRALKPVRRGDGGHEELEAVFSGVASAAEPHEAFGGVAGDDGVFLGVGGVGAEEGGEDGAAFGALDGEAGAGGAEVGEFDEGGVCGSGGVECGELSPVFVDAGGVDDEEEFAFAGAIGDEVVDDAAVVIEEEGVVAVAGGEAGDVVGEGVIEEGFGVGAIDDDLAHVGDVEDANVLADGVVFGHKAGILDGHFPAGEGDQAGSEGEVVLVEGGALEIFGHGGAILDAALGFEFGDFGAEGGEFGFNALFPVGVDGW